MEPAEEHDLRRPLPGPETQVVYGHFSSNFQGLMSALRNAAGLNVSKNDYFVNSMTYTKFSLKRPYYLDVYIILTLAVSCLSSLVLSVKISDF